ncbi:hypothetical protein OHV05_36105 (plasmid) [Kitasatospora sp. NBC_00070]|uniref:hypothetical protein n=1 Tax=Kitasatospora sp. NBC_00070 TaxID=2975962 RepID=UPI002F90A924
MSMIKQYPADAETVTRRATAIAQLEDDCMRWTALTELFRYCGDIAAAYTHQNRAVVALVEDVAEVYHAERYALRHPPQERAA